MTENKEQPIESVKMHVSLFKPLVIEIKGVEYPVREMARNDQIKLGEFDDMISGGDLDANYKRLEWLLGLKKSDPNIDSLSTREVADLTDQLIKKLYAADASDMRFAGGEKNVRRHGNKKSAK